VPSLGGGEDQWGKQRFKSLSLFILPGANGVELNLQIGEMNRPHAGQGFKEDRVPIWAEQQGNASCGNKRLRRWPQNQWALLGSAPRTRARR
jgi:hypothetical protein